MEMIHPELGTTRASGYIICTPDASNIYHCLLKLQLTIWLYIRLSFMTTDGGLKLELGSHIWSAHYVGASKKILDCSCTTECLKKQEWKGVLSMSKSCRQHAWSYTLCGKRSVGSDKWLSQLVKWLKIEKKNEGLGTRRCEGKACKFTYGNEHKI